MQLLQRIGWTMAMCGLLSAAHSQEAVESTEVDQVWAGHPVGFDLLTASGEQFVAYYDADRTMTVAQRTLPDGAWRYTELPETIGWDSHNYITMTIDDGGYLHLSGNMHGDPLVYFRTTQPLDARTLERAAMVGEHESRTTYPNFFTGPGGTLVFTYREGGSGDGFNVYNRYNVAEQEWTRLIDKPLLDGEGERNAYQTGPALGPDGFYHMAWVWRDTPDCETNHTVSYARSRDLVHWETSQGEPIALPITLATGDVVDPVGPGGGVINGNVHFGFDADQQVVVSYHKYDADGHTQIYNARATADGWERTTATDWDYRWEFSGRGSIEFEVRVRGVRVDGAGRLVQSFVHPVEGRGQLVLDPKTLRAIDTLSSGTSTPPAYAAVRSEFPGMEVHTRGGRGSRPEEGGRFILRWETLGRNRDRPREGPLPPPSVLEVLRVSD